MIQKYLTKVKTRVLIKRLIGPIQQDCDSFVNKCTYYYYRSQTKFAKVYVFTGVCLSTRGVPASGGACLGGAC